MRTAFIEQLCEMAESDHRVWLICGDIGFSVLEKFRDRFPRRFINCGVAEQNMIGVAAGLALCGKTVFVYSIANFPIMRCLEHIRNDVCYHNLNVKVVAVGGGLSYGSHGYTHHSVEDIAVMCAMPNMIVAAPGDPIEAQEITRHFVEKMGPGYLRLGKAGEPVVHDRGKTVEFGRAVRLREGGDLTLISTGGMLKSTVSAAQILFDRGLNTRVLSMPYIIPLDVESILDAAQFTGGIITIEEHGPGGLGSAVGEVIARAGIGTAFRTLRLSRNPIKVAGSQETLRAAQGLGISDIVDSAIAVSQRSLPAPTSITNASTT